MLGAPAAVAEVKPLLSPEEAAAVLFPGLPPKISRRRVYSWVRTKLLPAEIVFQAGRRIYLKFGPLAAWLSNGTQK